jgi:hypothetical protein
MPLLNASVLFPLSAHLIVKSRRYDGVPSIMNMCHGNPPFQVPGLSGPVVRMPYKRRRPENLQPRGEKCQVKGCKSKDAGFIRFLSPSISFFTRLEGATAIHEPER